MQSNDLMDKYTTFHSYGHARKLAKAQEQAMAQVAEAMDGRGEGEVSPATLRAAKPLCYLPRALCFIP